MKKIVLLLFWLTATGAYAQLVSQLGILDLTANSGNNPATGNPWAAGDTYRLVFVSSTTRNATSAAIGDYNAHVQAAANAAGLGAVTWYAIASTSTVNARSNTRTTVSDTDGSVFLMNGTEVVANNLADLWDGNIDTRIDINELGNPTSVSTPIWTPWTAVWTGTASNGNADGTRFLGAATVTLGLSKAELNFWVRRATHNDNTVALPIYGISEVLTIEDTPLPVELVRFEVYPVATEGVHVTWQTLTETNNDYFTIERSLDGMAWHEVAEVDGAGNSNVLISYRTVDHEPLKGISYYRLKQTDFDGQYDYSDIQYINMSGSPTTYFPNPVTDRLTIEGQFAGAEEIKVYNLLGQDLTVRSRMVEQSDKRIVIDLSDLISGTYYVKTRSGRHKIYKQ